MAIIASWSGDGLADGTPVDESTAGTGDDPFDAVTPDTFTVVDGGLHGPRIQVDQAAATDAQLIWSTTIAGALSAYALRAYVELSGYPASGAWRILDPRDASNVLLWWVDVHNSGTLRLKDPGGVTVDETAGPVPLGQLRLGAVVAPDGGGGAQVTVSVYEGDEETPFETLTATGLGVDFQQIRYGEPGTSPTLPRAWFDGMAVSDEAVEIGPVPAPVPEFPYADLATHLELLVGDAWVEVTPEALVADPITITRGRASNAGTAAPASLTATIRDQTGQWSPRNPRSPLHGKVGRNTPVRARVGDDPRYAYLPGIEGHYLSTPDGATLDLVDGVDVRMDITPDTWRPTSLDATLCSKYDFTGDELSWVLNLARDGRLRWRWSQTGAFADSFFAESEPIPADEHRLAVRVVAVGSDPAVGGVRSYTFYTAPTLSGPWTQLGDVIVGSGSSTMYNSSVPVEIGSAAGGEPGFGDARVFHGVVHGAQVRDLTGAVVADPGIAAQDAGATSWTGADGLTWSTHGTARILQPSRFHGEASSWAPRWHVSGGNVRMPIAASGPRLRLTQGAPALQSPMTREFSNPARTGIVAYWPMEDAAGAVHIAAADPDGATNPMTIGGVPDLAAYDGWEASAPIPIAAAGSFLGAVPTHTATGEISVRLFVFVDQLPAAEATLLTVWTTGTAAEWRISLGPGGELRTMALDGLDNVLLDTGLVAYFNMDARGFTILDLELSETAGGDVDWRTLIIDIAGNGTIDTSIPTTVDTGTLAGRTVGRTRQVGVSMDRNLGSTVIGHLAVANDLNAYASTHGPLFAWRGETCVDRMRRLCAENRVPLMVSGEEIDPIELGAQRIATLVDLLDEAAEIDGGIFGESRDELGLHYRTRGGLYNRPTALTVDYTEAGEVPPPLTPVEDTQGVINDWTAKRDGGSSARVVRTDGPLSILPPREGGMGRYERAKTFGVLTDERLADLAGWRVHLGTWDDARYPTVKMWAHTAPHLVEEIAAVNVGQRIAITQPPVWLPPEDIGLLVQGYKEILLPRSWEITANCSPAGPWDVAVVDQARADTGGSQLAAAVDETATGLLLATTAGPEWTQDGFDVPFDVVVAGERCTVTTVGEVLNVNPYFADDLTGWTPSNATLARVTDVVHPDGTASMEITPSGAAAAGGAWAGLIPVAPGATYKAMAWLYAAAGYDNLQVLVNWHDSAGAFLSSSLGPVTAVPADEWTHLQAPVTAPVGATQAALWVWQTSSPATTDIVHAWAVKLVPAVGPLSDHFGRTVTDGWGSNPTGHPWTIELGAPADYSVTDGIAEWVHTTHGDDQRIVLAQDVTGGFDIEVEVRTLELITGVDQFYYVLALSDGTEWISLRVQFATGGVIWLQLERQPGGGTIGPVKSIAPTVFAGRWIHVRFQLRDGVLRAKGWADGDAEPSTWLLMSPYDERTSGMVGLRSFNPPANTNTLPFAVEWRNFRVRTPQTFAVVRGVNGISKPLPAGAPAGLADPSYTAL